VIKVIWGSDWDPLLARDPTALLRAPMMETCVDGEYQTFKANDGAYVREHFFGKYPELLELVAAHVRRRHLAPEPRRPRPAQGLRRLPRRGRAQGQPTVILAKTVKGYGMGEAGEGKNITHQQKKLDDEDAARLPRPLQHPDVRRDSSARSCRSTSPPTTRRR
jgi:pyruvate dehydrogenase E1 component